MDLKKIKFNDEQKQKYLELFNKLTQSLIKSENIGQANAIIKLYSLLGENNPDFLKYINSVDIWGGSGAVWEVYIENKVDDVEFKKSIIELIDLMEETNILTKSIKSRKRLFLNDLKS